MSHVWAGDSVGAIVLLGSRFAGIKCMDVLMQLWFCQERTKYSELSVAWPLQFEQKRRKEHLVGVLLYIYHNLYSLLQEGYEVMVLNTNYNSDKGRQIRVSISICNYVG